MGRARRWAQYLWRTRQAYERGDLEALRELWHQGLNEPGIGFFLRFYNRLYPFQALLDLSVEVNRRMGWEGLASASRWLLETAGIPWECDVPSSTREVLNSGAALIYGNHPSLLTPFLLAAAVDRPDLRMIATNFLELFLPNFAPYAILVDLPVNRWWAQFREGGLERLVVAYWVTRLRPPLPREAAKEANARALHLGIEHVRNGGCLVIAPMGWTRRERDWYRGIGVIVKGLAERPCDRPVYLAPFREENTSDRLVRALLRAQGAGRLKRRLQPRPIRIRFAEAIPLRELGPLELTVPDLVRRLQGQYKALFS